MFSQTSQVCVCLYFCKPLTFSAGQWHHALFIKFKTMVCKCLSCKANALLQILQTDLSFGREYTAAIEAKQVGEY